MALIVHKHFFKERAEIYEDLAKTGHWPTTYVSGQSNELPLHWHDLDVSGYVVSGSTYLLDEAGQCHALSAGDKLEIPRGTLHAEGAVDDEVVYIVGTAEPGELLSQLALLSPDDQSRLAPQG